MVEVMKEFKGIVGATPVTRRRAGDGAGRA